MLRSHVARAIAVGASGALTTGALLAGAGAASAAPATVSNPTPLSYTCVLPVPNAPTDPPLTFTIEQTFTVPKHVESGAGVPAVPITDTVVFEPTALSVLGTLATAAGVSSVGGTLDGGFGLYGTGYDATFTIPQTQVADLAGLLGAPVTLSGTLPAPSAGKGPEQLTAPTVMYLTFPGLSGAKLGCGATTVPGEVSDDPGTDAATAVESDPVGDLVLAPRVAPSAKAGPGQTVVVAGPDGPVSASLMAAGHKRIVTGRIRDNKATLSFARFHLAKGSYRVTVRIGSATRRVTLRVR